MKVGAFEFFYAFARLIFVSRETGGERSRDLTGLREALRHLQVAPGGACAQGVLDVRCLGIFPEGRLCRHRGQIYPFQPGVGLLIARSGALVLPVIVREASVQQSAYASLYKPSRSVLEVMPLIDYQAQGLRAPAIVADLQARYEAWVGPVNHEPPLPTEKD
jgi:1-acyl-sn-glycerol-3-phosphate acyltransferase